MKKFEDTPESELAEIVKSQQEIKLEISEGLVKFASEIPSVDFSAPLEVPPTSAIHSPELAAAIVMYTGNDQQGKYIRFNASVYWANGKILYRKIAAQSYEMHVHWPAV